MLDTAAVADLVSPIAQAAIAPMEVLDLRIEEIVKFDGEKALQVIVVADALSFETLDARVHASVRMQHVLQAHGEDRYAYVDFNQASWLEDQTEDA